MPQGGAHTTRIVSGMCRRDLPLRPVFGRLRSPRSCRNNELGKASEGVRCLITRVVHTTLNGNVRSVSSSSSIYHLNGAYIYVHGGIRYLACMRAATFYLPILTQEARFSPVLLDRSLAFCFGSRATYRGRCRCRVRLSCLCVLFLARFVVL